MEIITRLPFDMKTKYYACLTYSSGFSSIKFIARRYHVSKASLMRWMKRFDGSEGSLATKSHRPLSPHPQAHTDEEIAKIRNLVRRNPHVGLNELYSKLRVQIGYSRHYSSLYRLLRRLGFYDIPHETHKKYEPKPYDTPLNMGAKAQLDVKFVPRDCLARNDTDDRYFQYTIIDEASRERFIYPYREQSSYSTVDFVRRAIAFFGYVPKIIQTDNGFEFTQSRDTPLVHLFDKLCLELGITHQLIKPRTPRHNGKVERSHRNDQQRFYQYLKFYDYDDLKHQMKVYLKRSNSICMSTLGWLTPTEKRAQLINAGMVA
jgi:transposase InsO family protein